MAETRPKQPIRVALIANGSFTTPEDVSGVPYFLARAVSRRAAVSTINCYPPRLVRWALRAVTARANRMAWDRAYVHGFAAMRTRSAIRDLKLLHSGPTDHLLHIRSWFAPSATPYSAFIDATTDMLQGVAPKWTVNHRQHLARVEREREYYRKAALIFVASRAAESSLIERYEIDRDKIVFVGNGLNQLGPLKAVARSGKPRRVLFVGREPLRKGLDVLLSAMAEVVEILPDATLTVVGTDWHAIQPSPKWLDYRGLVRDRSELSAIYDEHDVFCLPARQESFGLVAVEALSRGLPCVVSSVGELPNTVRDRLEGRVVAAEDAGALATALIEIMVDNEEFSRMSSRALARASAFDWDEIAEQILRRIADA